MAKKDIYTPRAIECGENLRPSRTYIGFGSLLYTSLLMYGKDLYTPRAIICGVDLYTPRAIICGVDLRQSRTYVGFVSMLYTSLFMFVTFAIYDRFRQSLIYVSFDVCRCYFSHLQVSFDSHVL